MLQPRTQTLSSARKTGAQVHGFQHTHYNKVVDFVNSGLGYEASNNGAFMQTVHGLAYRQGFGHLPMLQATQMKHSKIKCNYVLQLPAVADCSPQKSQSVPELHVFKFFSQKGSICKLKQTLMISEVILLERSKAIVSTSHYMLVVVGIQFLPVSYNIDRKYYSR